jgi:pimeloyl-ACP methyl ester carboxylesterase
MRASLEAVVAYPGRRLERQSVAPPLGPGDLITVPASVLVPHEPRLPIPPESWLRRAYPNLTRLVTLDEGGHFLALESPERFVTEIRDAFRPCRGSA